MITVLLFASFMLCQARVEKNVNLQSKIHQMRFIQDKLRDEWGPWAPERYELNSEIGNVLEENIDYLQKTEKQESENKYLKSEMTTLIVGFGGIIIAIVIINIMAHLVFKYKCCKHLCCQKSKTSTNYDNLHELDLL
eukprot:325378_1